MRPLARLTRHAHPQAYYQSTLRALANQLLSSHKLKVPLPLPLFVRLRLIASLTLSRPLDQGPVRELDERLHLPQRHATISLTAATSSIRGLQCAHRRAISYDGRGRRARLILRFFPKHRRWQSASIRKMSSLSVQPDSCMAAPSKLLIHINTPHHLVVLTLLRIVDSINSIALRHWQAICIRKYLESPSNNLYGTTQHLNTSRFDRQLRHSFVLRRPEQIDSGVHIAVNDSTPHIPIEGANPAARGRMLARHPTSIVLCLHSQEYRAFCLKIVYF